MTHYEYHESPAAISRRTETPDVLELLALHRRSAERHGVARVADLDPLSLPHMRDNLILLRQCEDGDLAYVHYGAGVARGTGFDMTGRRISDLHGEIGSFFAKTYARVLSEGVPLLTVHTARYSIRVQSWERLVLPLRDADGTRAVLVHSHPRLIRSDLVAAVLDASPDAIMALRFVRDEAGEGEVRDATIVAANRRAAEVTGKPLYELIDARLLQAFPGLIPGEIWKRYAGTAATPAAFADDAADAEAVTRFEVDYSSDGLAGCFQVAVAPLEDGVTITFTDISALKAVQRETEQQRRELERQKDELAAEIAARRLLEGELQRLAVTDGLTGVLNRRGFMDALRRATASAQRYGGPLSIVVCDVDHFKRINDAHGHEAGDAVLMAFAATLSEACRQDVDFVGRLGGEEFAVLLPVTPLAGAVALAKRLRRLLGEHPVHLDGRAIRVTASFGVQQIGSQGDPQLMLREADQALYAAKRAGRDTVLAFLPDASDACACAPDEPCDRACQPAAAPVAEPYFL